MATSILSCRRKKTLEKLNTNLKRKVPVKSSLMFAYSKKRGDKRPQNIHCISSEQLPVKILPQTYTPEMVNAEACKSYRALKQFLLLPQHRQ